jgi:hypothetical protein
MKSFFYEKKIQKKTHNDKIPQKIQKSQWFLPLKTQKSPLNHILRCGNFVF